MWYTPFSPSRAPWWTVSIRIWPGSPLGSGLARSPIGSTDGLVLVNLRASPSRILFLRRWAGCATDIIEMFLYSSWPYSWNSRSSILLVAGPLRQSWSSSVLASSSISARVYFPRKRCLWYCRRRSSPLRQYVAISRNTWAREYPDIFPRYCLTILFSIRLSPQYLNRRSTDSIHSYFSSPDNGLNSNPPLPSRNFCTCSIVRTCLSSMISRMVPMINGLPETVQSHLVLEITPFFSLILCWKRLGLDKKYFIWYYSSLRIMPLNLQMFPPPIIVPSSVA